MDAFDAFQVRTNSVRIDLFCFIHGTINKYTAISVDDNVSIHIHIHLILCVSMVKVRTHLSVCLFSQHLRAITLLNGSLHENEENIRNHAD